MCDSVNENNKMKFSQCARIQKESSFSAQLQLTQHIKSLAECRQMLQHAVKKDCLISKFV